MAIVSVIITNYNYENYLASAIKSATVACDNAKVVHEVVTVTDNPESPCNIGYKNEKNMGVSYSRNRGIKNSTGDYIVILDGDDMLTPESITEQLKVFEANPKADMVHGRVYRFEGDATYEQCISNRGKYPKHPSLITCQGMMVKREVFEKFGLYYEGLRSAEDKEMLYRWGLHRHSPLPIIINALKIKVCTAFYRRHGNSKRKRRKYDRSFEISTMMAFDARIMHMVQYGANKGVELLEKRDI